MKLEFKNVGVMGWCVPKVLVACLIAVAMAAPQLEVEAEVPLSVEPEVVVESLPQISVVGSGIDERPAVALLRDERVDSGDGNFNFAFEADNGVAMAVEGTPGVEGGVSMSGSYR